MELDRQAIERKDFPIGRRGYDPDAVDAHLRALAQELEELQRVAASGAPDVSLASAAGSHVQGIIEAAETAAGDIQRQALEDAQAVREGAERDADRTREDALERARVHVAAVGQSAAVLLERVGSMDGEVSALIDSLRAGASRLASDLSAVETGMRDLYDSASGHSAEPAPPAQAAEGYTPEFEDALAALPEPAPEPPRAAAPEPQPAGVSAGGAQQGGEGAGDLDGARLVALNMALNGESRADTERYLAENFQLPDRLKLIDEVYAAIEG